MDSDRTAGSFDLFPGEGRRQATPASRGATTAGGSLQPVADQRPQESVNQALIDELALLLAELQRQSEL
ncbi:hypothetical protein HNP46_000998 [Pseudomonas nitritireducens]|uniref:Uncharacterized protein n=1 Tax=Pseudomonas nitroreducens TaxID=46680 RepID=A0A7W7P0B0_PSENT|nr:hypothetical protein [Pseudomonas nitritireducens]MBB4862160.1 hypothetical protein [Pseudomonas nitritireducens]